MFHQPSLRRFNLSPRRSPVLSRPQIVVESPTSYKAPVGFTEECLAVDRAALFLPQESQVSQLLSMQLSPNRVQEDYDFDTIDIFSIYTVSLWNKIFPQCIPDSITRRYEHTGLPGDTSNLFGDERSNHVVWQRRPEPGYIVINQLCCRFDLVVGTVNSISGSYVVQTCTGPGVRPSSYPGYQPTHAPAPSVIRHRRFCHARGHLTLLESRLTPVIILWSHLE